ENISRRRTHERLSLRDTGHGFVSHLLPSRFTPRTVNSPARSFEVIVPCALFRRMLAQPPHDSTNAAGVAATCASQHLAQCACDGSDEPSMPQKSRWCGC